jgi:two-component system KDP operon response regulator KdpE
VADTDPAIGLLLRRKLPALGFDVELGESGAAVLSQVAAGRPDAVVVGSDLPDISALDLIAALHADPAVPVLVLLSDQADAALIAAFDAGADDCIGKPFLVGELAARLRKLVRQTLAERGIQAVIRSEGLEIDCVRWRIRRDGNDVVLNAREQAMLRMLVEGTGNVLSTRAILQHLWDTDDLERAGRVRNLIKRLASKLGLSGASTLHIEAESQLGYRLRTPPLPSINASAEDRPYERE